MNKLDEVLQTGYDFQMGKYLGDGWDYFKRGAGNYIGFLIVFLIISIISSLVLGLIPIVGGVVSTIIQYLLMAGVFVYTRNMLNGQSEFGDFFKGFNYVKDISLFTLVYLLLMIPGIVLLIMAILPEGTFELLQSNDPQQIVEELQYLTSSFSGITFLWIFLVIIYFLYISISYSFALIFIVDRNMAFWDAMETSRKVVGKNFISFVLMFIVIYLIVAVSAIPCGLGLLVTIPFSMTTVFAAYENIIGPEDDGLSQQVEEFGNPEE